MAWWEIINGDPLSKTPNTNLQRPACSGAEFLVYQQKSQSIQCKHFLISSKCNILTAKGVLQWKQQVTTVWLSNSAPGRSHQKNCRQVFKEKPVRDYSEQHKSTFPITNCIIFTKDDICWSLLSRRFPPDDPKTTGTPNTTPETHPFSSPTPQSARLRAQLCDRNYHSSTIYGLNCVPPNFICCSPNSQHLRMWSSEIGSL